MDTSTYKFNRILLSVFWVAPFAGYVLFNFLGTDFNTVMQLFSYIGVILIFVFKPQNVKIKIPNYLLYYLLFILYVFYRDLIGLDREFKIIYLFKNALIGGFNFMFIIENIPFPKKYYRSMLKVSRYILIIAFLVILVQQAVNPNFFMIQNADFNPNDVIEKSDNDNRLFSIYSWFGGLVEVGFGFVPVFLLVIEDLDKKKKKIMIWLLVGLVFALLTKARWIMVNSLLVFVILFINHRDKAIRFFKFLFFIPLIIYIASFGLNAVGIDPMGIINERILEKKKTNLNETSASTRLLAFKIFGKLYMDSPILGAGNVKYGMGGTGIQSYKMRRILKGKSSQIHVGYLSLLYRYGLVGGFFFLSFLFLLLRKLYRNAKKSGIWAPFLGMSGLFFANLTLVTFFMMQMGFFIVLIADRFYHQDTKNRKRIHAK